MAVYFRPSPGGGCQYVHTNKYVIMPLSNFIYHPSVEETEAGTMGDPVVLSSWLARDAARALPGHNTCPWATIVPRMATWLSCAWLPNLSGTGGLPPR